MRGLPFMLGFASFKAPVYQFYGAVNQPDKAGQHQYHHHPVGGPALVDQLGLARMKVTAEIENQEKLFSENGAT